jgi:hypothetical protein
VPRRCSVCANKHTAEISKELLAGGSIRGVASRYHIVAASVGRHLRGCLRTVRKAEKLRGDEARTSVADSSRFDSLDPKTLVAATARLVDEALDLLGHAKKADDRRTALVALREARDGLALLMKAAGMLAGDVGTTVIDNRKQVLNVLGKLSEDELRAIVAGKPVPALEGETVLRDVTDNRTLTAPQ